MAKDILHGAIEPRNTVVGYDDQIKLGEFGFICKSD